MSDVPRLASVLLASRQDPTSADDACSTANVGPRVPKQVPARAATGEPQPQAWHSPRLGFAWVVMLSLVALTSLAALGGMVGH